MLAAGAAALATPAIAQQRYDAVVGAGGFASLGAALAAAPKKSKRPFRIFIQAGRWREKLVIDKPNIALGGAGRDQSIVTFDAAAGMPGPDGKPWGTWGCASLRVTAPGFSARNLTIENAFDYVGDLTSPKFERVGSNGAQAVALMLDSGSDRAIFENVAITGHQDTLFTDAGRALFRNCTISGSVDFIFGGATALFDRCEIVSRFRPLMQRNHGFVSAPCTPETSAFGLVFLDCRLTREEQVPPASVVLGRSWRPTRTFADGRYGDPQARGASAFLRCWMDDHISADGWDEMAYTDKTGARVFLQPSQARFREYASTGPGAFENRRRPWMAQTEAETFTPARILGDWRPA